MSPIRLMTPLKNEDIEKLKAGQAVLISGLIYTARDAAHKKLVNLLEEGKPLPIELKGQIIYYVGPSPAKPGQIIGSAGPTTSGRMDSYTPQLIELGLKGMIGKGKRDARVIKSMEENNAVYFVAVGGAAALIAKSITKCRVVAYPELGAEAIHELFVEDFPVLVANDIFGGDLFKEGIEQYKNKNLS
ncbi:MAG: Fe-S-containing hydro-lyase [Peptococcaceae bacterium]|nr:Fe-S-containing hydro-lyase [Peptococcaceae bacterium]